MVPATTDIKSAKRPGQAGLPVLVRLQPASVAALDTWISAQDDAPTRPEAIRRLVERGLAS